MSSLSQTSLSTATRQHLKATFARDGFAILPITLPADMQQAVLTALDTAVAAERRARGSQGSVKLENIVDLDPAFRRLLCFDAALQMTNDIMGPSFQLCQSNLVSRPRDDGSGSDFLNGTPWHADGPRPGLFPRVGPAMGLHYLKFAYFLNDIPADGGSPLQVVRASHLRDELDDLGPDFDITDHHDEVVEFRCTAGTIVAFHQALWHAAAPNTSSCERKNCYISYCPRWMRPYDRQPMSPAAAETCTALERSLLGVADPDPRRHWKPTKEELEPLAAFA